MSNELKYHQFASRKDDLQKKILQLVGKNSQETAEKLAQELDAQ